MNQPDENVTGETIGVTIGGVTVNVDPKMLRAYKRESFDFLTEEANAKASFKKAVETMSETFGIEKGVLSKWLKAAFKAETKKTTELAQAFEQLDVAAA